MNLVDSSGWLEYFADGPNADFFAPAIGNLEELFVTAINLYEVFKRVLQQEGEDKALEAVAVMMQAKVIDIDPAIAFRAAKISDELKIPMAGSLILAAARNHDAILWTQDADFSNIPDVKFISKTAG